jgi:alpha-beta hydrolase superfamily lysophospholipase
MDFPQSFVATDGVEIICRSQASQTGAARAAIGVIHGMGDHGGALPYQYLTRYLSENGFASYALDLRGHGNSGGLRMYVDSWRQIRADISTFVELIKIDSPGLPVFLVGMSMGGMIALNFAGHSPEAVDGIVAVAPAVDPTGAPLYLRLAIPLLAIITPKIRLNTGLKYSNLTRDTAALAEYTADPNFQTAATPRFAAELLQAIKETNVQAAQFKLSLLILHGMADRIVPAVGSEKYFASVAAPDKQRITYEGGFHNLFIEPNREEVFADIAEWLGGKCQ